MLVGVKSISVGAINKLMDGGVEPFLVRATDEQDGAVFQNILRNAVSRGKLLMISRNRVMPAFFANQFAILGEVALGMIVKIVQVAAQVDDYAPDQSATGQFDCGGTFGVDRAFFRMVITENVCHLLVIFHAAPGILARVVSNPGNARDASEQIVCFGPEPRRPSVTFGFHTFERWGLFGRGIMRARRPLPPGERTFQARSG